MSKVLINKEILENAFLDLLLIKDKYPSLEELYTEIKDVIDKGNINELKRQIYLKMKNTEGEENRKWYEAYEDFKKIKTL